MTLSGSWPERDLIQKRAEYAEAGVPEYWIVNPQTQTITVLRLEGGAYGETGHCQRGQMAGSVLLAGFSVAVAAVFDPDRLCLTISCRLGSNPPVR
jgi:Uma2 family endonuclease